MQAAGSSCQSPCSRSSESSCRPCRRHIPKKIAKVRKANPLVPDSYRLFLLDALSLKRLCKLRYEDTAGRNVPPTYRRPSSAEQLIQGKAGRKSVSNMAQMPSGVPAAGRCVTRGRCQVRICTGINSCTRRSNVPMTSSPLVEMRCILTLAHHSTWSASQCILQRRGSLPGIRKTPPRKTYEPHKSTAMSRLARRQNLDGLRAQDDAK